MKLQSVLWIASLSAWLWTAAAGAERPIAALIQDLADERFATREAASRQLWQIGPAALEALQQAATASDPEQAYRARELVRRIELDLTPETDPAILALADRYGKGSTLDKARVLRQLHQRRAWRQILKLYTTEKSPEVQSQLERWVAGVAVAAARECLVAGNAKGAREFLELAPADALGMLALADFHRSQGSLNAEMKRAKSLKSEDAAAWLLALYRVAGKTEAARDAATAAGEPQVAAAMSVLLGDPLPWLRLRQTVAEGESSRLPYTELAIQHWQGKSIQGKELERLQQAAGSRKRSERQGGQNALFLLGQAGMAEPSLVQSSPLLAFSYFESLERIPEALKALGLDADRPDYAAWVATRIGHLAKGDIEDEHEVAMDAPELLVVANFLERRGLQRVSEEAFLAPLAALAEKDPKVFRNFLGKLFGIDDGTSGATRLAKRAAVAWAGDDRERWNEVVAAAFGDRDETMSWWDWLAELLPTASRAERLDQMLALFGMAPDPQRLRESGLALVWAAIDSVAVENRKPLLERMAFLSSQTEDVANSLKVWDQLAEGSRASIFWRAHILDLSAAGRWDEAAAFFLQQIERVAKLKQEPVPYLHASVAACLRNAGHAQAAAAQDAWVDKLALGNEALEIANAYAYGNDYARAAEWWLRALRQSDPNSTEFATALQLYADVAVEQGKWKEVAAISEVLAQMLAAADSDSESPLVRLRIRLQSDLGRAMVRLKSDRAGSIALLQNCHQLFPGDGSLADSFFPAIRKAGLSREHDTWYKDSSARLAAVIRQFPESDNTYNTAGWLSARTCRDLDQAEANLQKALAMNPYQVAYLDTMAEVQFAKGKRKEALEWSARAVNYRPTDPQLRRQHERFRSSPLPR